MNNAVYDSRNRIIGFHCRECNGVFESMWWSTCNGCREAELRHQELIAVLKDIANAQHNI